MSDDFDLLETNSQEKAEKVDVNWGKAIDQMKSKLAQELVQAKYTINLEGLLSG